MENYTFRKCTLPKLEKWFGLHRSFKSAALEQWLQAQTDFTDFEQATIHHLQERLVEYVEVWNEDELALNFIGPILGLVNLRELYRFNIFAQRKIGDILPGVNGDIELSGEPDSMVATGYWEPEIPMFAFTEYKRYRDPEGDPAGQNLAAMLVAQNLDTQPQPIYGCYVIGYDWRFMVLEDKTYTISRNFSAITDEIFDLLRILKTLKQIILDLTA